MNRSIQLEGSFGVIKENYKFRQFLRRGKKVKIEFLLIFRTFNIRKFNRKMKIDRLGVAFHQKNLCWKSRRILF